ncbi:hypothetical protein BH11VER1_BH11VER1_19970 [soil metagenome]
MNSMIFVNPPAVLWSMEVGRSKTSHHKNEES